MVLDFIGAILLTALIVVCVNAVVSTMALPPARKLVFAGAAGLWIGLQVALATAGAFANGPAAVPLLGIMVITPPLLVFALTRASPAFRTGLLGVPTHLLVGLNAGRLVGALFILLAAAGRLGGPFPQSAGWGDILTGALALPLAFAIARGTVSRGAVAAWNAFGLLDLVVAVSLGVMSAEGSPLQLIHAAGGSSAIQHLPWALIPTVLVPFYLTVHGLIYTQQRMRREVRGNPMPRMA